MFRRPVRLAWRPIDRTKGFYVRKADHSIFSNDHFAKCLHRRLKVFDSICLQYPLWFPLVFLKTWVYRSILDGGMIWMLLRCFCSRRSIVRWRRYVHSMVRLMESLEFDADKKISVSGYAYHLALNMPPLTRVLWLF